MRWLWAGFGSRGAGIQCGTALPFDWQAHSKRGKWDKRRPTTPLRSFRGASIIALASLGKLMSKFRCKTGFVGRRSTNSPFLELHATSSAREWLRWSMLSAFRSPPWPPIALVVIHEESCAGVPPKMHPSLLPGRTNDRCRSGAPSRFLCQLFSRWSAALGCAQLARTTLSVLVQEQVSPGVSGPGTASCPTTSTALHDRVLPSIQHPS